jgi:hypothetical protein
MATGFDTRPQRRAVIIAESVKYRFESVKYRFSQVLLLVLAFQADIGRRRRRCIEIYRVCTNQSVYHDFSTIAEWLHFQLLILRHVWVSHSVSELLRVALVLFSPTIAWWAFALRPDVGGTLFS